jgi:hypothetical protein
MTWFVNRNVEVGGGGKITSALLGDSRSSVLTQIIMVCDAIYPGANLPTFRRNLLPQSSG